MNCSNRHLSRSTLNLQKCLVVSVHQYIDDGEQTDSNRCSSQPGNFGKVLSAYKLQDAIRTYGHLAADIYPLNDRPKDSTRIELSYYGLTESDLAVNASITYFLKMFLTNVENGLDAINYLKSLYTGKIAYEFYHVIDEEERNWIQSKIENGEVSINLSADDKKALLERLTKIEGLKNSFTVHLSVQNDSQLKDWIHLSFS